MKGQVSMELLAILGILFIMSAGVAVTVGLLTGKASSFEESSGIHRKLGDASSAISYASYSDGTSINITLPERYGRCTPDYSLENDLIIAACEENVYIFPLSVSNVTNGTSQQPFSISDTIMITSERRSVEVIVL